MDKIPVAVDGATGMTGRAITQLLENHPYFEVVALIGHRSAERVYGDVFDEKEKRLVGHYGPVWVPAKCPTKFKDFIVKKYDPDSLSKEVDLVFTLLPPEAAKVHEKAYANRGLIVVSNAGAMRMRRHVPLVVTEINHTDFAKVKIQKIYKYRGGGITANPNCSATNLALTLEPIDEEFRIKEVYVFTEQALSGKGDVNPNDPIYANGAMIGTVHTEIPGEEEKIEEEIPKIMHWNKNKDRVNAKCTRVYVQHGHMEGIRIKTEKPASIELVKEGMLYFDPLKDYKKVLPSAPDKPIVYKDAPNTKVDVNTGKGMSVTVGEFRQRSENEFDFMAIGHNLIRGAGGQSLLNAEMLLHLYL